MATNINFTNDLNDESDANISYNLPRKIYRDSLKRAVAAGATAEAESCTYNIMLDMDYERLLNRASLLVTPTLYKEGVLYPQIPTYNSNGDFSVTRATTATRTNSSGLIESTPINEPRLDYSLGSCPNILLEPQRTNLALRSNTFQNAAWEKTNLTAVDNSVSGIDGNLSASVITTSSTFNLLYQLFTVTPGQVMTFTFYVKRGTMTDLKYRVRDQTNNVDVIPVTSYYSQTNSSTFTRIPVTVTIPAGCTSIRFYIMSDTNSVGTAIVTAAQLEAGAYPTSYIPTSSASVTRNLDQISSTIPSILNASSGTLFVDAFPVVTSAINQTIATINDGTTSRGFWLGLDNGVLQVRFRNNGGITAASSSFSITNLQRIKIALTWNGSGITLFVNGVKRFNNILLGANYPSTINTIQMQGDGSFFSINRNFINSMALFPTPLTDGECSMLTSGVYTPALAYAQLGLVSESPACLDSSVNALL
jgi:hypothetical protein